MEIDHSNVDSLLASAGWRQTLVDFNDLCAYCQERRYEEVEHFTPQSKGGRTHITNCLPACSICNKRKSSFTGDALIGVFGQTTIERLQHYLLSRSNQIDGINHEVITPPTKKRRKSIRLRVKELAEKQGLNQRQLAAKSGVTAQLINRYWNYQMQRVDLDALEKIAKALGCKVADLIEEEDEEDAA